MHTINVQSTSKLGKKIRTQPSKHIAWQIIDQFYQYFDVEDVEEDLGLIALTIMKTKNKYLNRRERRNFLFLLEYLTELNWALAFLQSLNQKVKYLDLRK